MKVKKFAGNWEAAQTDSYSYSCELAGCEDKADGVAELFGCRFPRRKISTGHGCWLTKHNLWDHCEPPLGRLDEGMNNLYTI